MFSIDYRQRRLGVCETIFALWSEGLANRQIARFTGLCETVVRQRLKRLAEQSFLVHARKTANLEIQESLAYDGLRNFAGSQYEPNDTNQLVGMKSLFIYDFNVVPLNRRGRMSERQRARLAATEAEEGRFPERAVRHATVALLTRAHRRRAKDATLSVCTDEHYQYRDAIKQDLRKKGIRVDHATISSKAARVYRHILFSVNHSDLLSRQYVKAFARETISFSKHRLAMAEKFMLFTVMKNYFRPQYTKRQKRNPNSNKQSPAMVLGLENKILKFDDFFGQRLGPGQVTALSKEWRGYLRGRMPYGRGTQC